MTYIYALDRLLNKPVKVKIKEDKDIQPGDKILYREDDKVFAAIYLGYGCDADKKGEFITKLKGYTLKNFEKRQKKAQKYFDNIFTDLFPEHFPSSVPITAKMAYKTDIVYFYFFAEERFDFREFLDVFKKKIDTNFFLYQVGARDRVRLNPDAEGLCGSCGKKLCCKRYKCPLPSTESDNIPLQNLSSRGIENLKGRCGKLKCCLNYEKQLYKEEVEKYPKKWEKFKLNGKKYECRSFNIMTGEIIVKTADEQRQTKKLNIDNFNFSDITNA